MDNTAPLASSRSNDFGPNTESKVNYALASDDGLDQNIATSHSQVSNTSDIFFRTIVASSSFQNMILFLITINSIMMGIGTTDIVTQDPDLKKIFDTIDYTFLVVFTVELIIDFGSFGLGLFKSGWRTFDFLVISLSWLYPRLQIIRLFRALRLLSRFEYVRKIMYALQSVLPVMGSIVVLLSFIFYVAAVIFTELFGDMYDEGTLSADYFGNLGVSLFTLFQVMTGAGWPDIAREVIDTYNWAWFPFVLFVSVTMFVVVELTIAALVKSISVMEEEEMDVLPVTGGKGDERVLQLEQKLDGLTKRMSTSSLAITPTPQMDTEATRNSARASPSQFSSENRLFGKKKRNNRESPKGDVEWYDKLTLSFDEPEDKEISSVREAREISNAYNCFPDFVQSKCGLIANNELFQNAIVLFILINSITMGLATYDFIKGDPYIEAVFNVVDMVFLVIFTVELCIQFGYRGSAFFNSGWLIFDFIVIAVSWMMLKVQVARAFRCFRLFSRVRSMRTIIIALSMVAPKLAVIGELLLLLFYIMSVVFTDLFKDMYDNGLTSRDYFGSLGKTSFTLFQCMTIAGWPDIAREVMMTYSWAWYPFVTWIILSKFTMIQLIIAILCQSLAHVDEKTDDENDPSSNNDEPTLAGAFDDITRLEAKIDALASNIDTLCFPTEQHQQSLV